MSTPSPSTLCIDCGGGGIKAAVLDAEGTAHAQPARIPTPYPLPPARLLRVVRTMAAQLPACERVTMGLPGMIRHGVVIWTPHYINRGGPRTRVDPDLVAAWTGFDMAAALGESLGVPALVLNDAEVHGAGVIAGTGLELVVTFGTGLGSALFDGGALAPHLELSHAPFTRTDTIDEYIGEHERKALGDPIWSRRVRKVIVALRPVVRWDRLYVGGGNSRMITPTTLAKFEDDIVVVSNTAGISGGARAWALGPWAKEVAPHG
ncbi:MAG: ROK family protein [Bifidobacteriaceae bacterium]|nr:ROK family protein [Bifidobacteriaceae bacterium]